MTVAFYSAVFCCLFCFVVVVVLFVCLLCFCCFLFCLLLFSISTEVVYLQRCLVITWLVPWETAVISAHVLCAPCNQAAFWCHIMQSHTRRYVHACLSVTCHLHFWQNDLDLLRATSVTRGWGGFRIKSQHRKLTMEKKILPPLHPLPGICSLS